MRCRGNNINRRGFLAVGAAGGLGLTLPSFFRLQSLQAAQQNPDPIEAKATRLIHVFLPGGMAHQESFDPKPYAPIEYRGELGTLKAKTGEVFCNSIPKLASIADKFTVIRSMTHGEAAHERGTHNMFTGYKPSPAVNYPSMGSVVSHEFGPRKNLPPYVCIPNVPNEFAANGYLSSSYGPFSLGADPAQGNFQVRDLGLRGIDAARFARRQQALATVNQQFGENNPSDAVGAMNTFYQRAYDLVGSAEAQAAFDLSKESDALRDEYGRNQAGARMLMARRLVEAGVRFVTLTYGGWDMHNQIANGIKSQMPALDQGLTALINDLDRTGLLEDTVVMVSSEFGRTPKINGTAGRDHWPKVFSVLMAGGGFKRGLAYGTSDSTAAEPQDDPVSPEDLATTMYRQLGIVATKELMAPGNRPIEIVDGGKFVSDLVA